MAFEGLRMHSGRPAIAVGTAETHARWFGTFTSEWMGSTSPAFGGPPQVVGSRSVLPLIDPACRCT
jgi:hypothetical protein